MVVSVQRLQLLPQRLAVTRRPPGDAVPDWFPDHGLRHVTWAADELSLLCEDTAVPADEPRVERGWRALRLQGPFDFALTGILLSVPMILIGLGLIWRAHTRAPEAEVETEVSAS